MSGEKLVVKELELKDFWKILEKQVQISVRQALSKEELSASKKWVNTEEALNILQCSSSKLRKLKAKHQIVYTGEGRGGNCLYLLSSLNEYLEQHSNLKYYHLKG